MSDWIHRLVAPSAIVISVGAIPCYATTYLTVGQAQKICFPDATQFVPADVTLTRRQMKAIQKDSGVWVRLPTEKVWRAVLADGHPGNRFLGWFIADEVLGKHEYIHWALALNADGSVRQIEILVYKETYGYQVREAQWQAQFTGKQHGARLKLGADVKNISGATLSCRHLTDGVKRLLSFYALVLKH
jgi:Na+-translocating ferredoxin:NAD+ oxidoreductase RnfG subunit